MAKTVLQPTVIIGLGTSGAKMIQGVQRQMYEMFKMNSLPIFRYIVIETNRKYDADATPSGQDIKVLNLGTGGTGTYDNFEELLDQFKHQNIVPDWIDRSLARDLTAQGEGAGGVRPVGRLLLWANMRQVKDAIDGARRKVLSDQAIRETEKLLQERVPGRDGFRISTTKPNDPKHAHAIVCGTSTGGTYSGSFIDLGYICQRVLQIPETNRDSIFSVTLLPPKQITGTGQSDLHRFKGNAYGAILEEQYFSSQKEGVALRRYKANVPEFRSSFDTSAPPYHYSYLISQEYGEGSLSISSPSALSQLASLKLFCDLMGLESKRVERTVDDTSAGKDSTLTFGLAAIMHPRYQIGEFAACEASIRVFQRWTNEEHYVDNAGRRNSVPGASTLEGTAKTAWEGDPSSGKPGLLRQRLNQLTSQESDLGFFGSTLKKDVDRLKEGQIEPVLRSFLEPGDTYYGRIKRNIPSVGDGFVEELKGDIHERLEKTQSIPYAIAYATALKRAASDLLEYWDRFNIPKEHQAWTEYVTGELYRTLQGIASNNRRRLRNLLATRGDLLEAEIAKGVERLKLHLLRPKIEDVQKALEEEIATLEKYQKMVVGSQKILEKRKSSIKNTIADDSLPIGHVWGYGSFEKDVDQVLDQLVDPQPSAEHLADTSSYSPSTGTTWMASTLKMWHDSDEDRVLGSDAQGNVGAEKAKQKYQNRAMDIIDRRFDIDLDQAVRKRLVDRYFSRGKQCHLLYKRPDGRKAKTGEHLIGPRSATTKDVRGKIKESIGAHFDSGDTIELPGIDHMLIYYREEIVGDPLKVLEDREDLEKSFCSAPNDSIINERVRSSWTDLRVAYDVPKRLREEADAVVQQDYEERLRRILDVVGTFLFEWQRQNGAAWHPVGVRPEAEDLSLSVGNNGDGGPPEPKWVVELALESPRGYTVVGKDGKPQESTIRKLVDDNKAAQRVIQDGREAIGRLGREGLKRLWKENVLDRIRQQSGPEAVSTEARRYFGSEDKEGVIEKLLRDSPSTKSLDVPCQNASS